MRDGMMPSKLLKFWLSAMALVLLAGCAAQMEMPATATPTQTVLTATVIPPTNTPEPTLTPTATHTPTLTPTITLTPTATVIPFTGFMDNFAFYRSWYKDEKTVFYFLNAGVDHTLYARADEFDLVCNPDPELATSLVCVHDAKVEGKSVMEFEFFVDEGRKMSVYKNSFNTGLADNTIYHWQNNCPDRGKNVTCESEYRLYDGVCYYSHTCYDACGLYYSMDNLPKVFTEFQGFTGPCN